MTKKVIVKKCIWLITISLLLLSTSLMITSCEQPTGGGSSSSGSVNTITNENGSISVKDRGGTLENTTWVFLDNDSFTNYEPAESMDSGYTPSYPSFEPSIKETTKKEKKGKSYTNIETKWNDYIYLTFLPNNIVIMGKKSVKETGEFTYQDYEENTYLGDTITSSNSVTDLVSFKITSADNPDITPLYYGTYTAESTNVSFNFTKECKRVSKDGNSSYYGYSVDAYNSLSFWINSDISSKTDGYGLMKQESSQTYTVGSEELAIHRLRKYSELGKNGNGPWTEVSTSTWHKTDFDEKMKGPSINTELIDLLKNEGKAWFITENGKENAYEFSDENYYFYSLDKYELLSNKPTYMVNKSIESGKWTISDNYLCLENGSDSRIYHTVYDVEVNTEKTLVTLKSNSRTLNLDNTIEVLKDFKVPDNMLYASKEYNPNKLWCYQGASFWDNEENPTIKLEYNLGDPNSYFGEAYYKLTFNDGETYQCENLLPSSFSISNKNNYSVKEEYTVIWEKANDGKIKIKKSNEEEYVLNFHVPQDSELKLILGNNFTFNRYVKGETKKIGDIYSTPVETPKTEISVDDEKKEFLIRIYNQPEGYKIEYQEFNDIQKFDSNPYSLDQGKKNPPYIITTTTNGKEYLWDMVDSYANKDIPLETGTTITFSVGVLKKSYKLIMEYIDDPSKFNILDL